MLLFEMVMVLEDPDQDTLRVLVSTDNHLGFMERDPIRGMDSFAALEEVLHLAKKHKVPFSNMMWVLATEFAQLRLLFTV